MKTLNVITAAMMLTVGSTAFATKDRGGGNYNHLISALSKQPVYSASNQRRTKDAKYYINKFIEKAREASNFLKVIQDGGYVSGASINTDEYLQTIDDLVRHGNIEVVEAVEDDLGRSATAVNFPDRNVVLLSQSAFDQMELEYSDDEIQPGLWKALAAHEILSLLKRESTDNYSFSTLMLYAAFEKLSPDKFTTAVKPNYCVLQPRNLGVAVYLSRNEGKKEILKPTRLENNRVYLIEANKEYNYQWFNYFGMKYERGSMYTVSARVDGKPYFKQSVFVPKGEREAGLFWITCTK